MKSLALTLLLISTYCYSQPLPDLTPEPPSISFCYYPNNGQLLDANENPVSNILYYTNQANPAVYVDINKVILQTVKRDTTDTLEYRLDMTFACNFESEIPTSCTENISVSEQSNHYVNYYYPHCNNGIKNVSGYQRVVYENAFNGIDYHLYSNEFTHKSYIVVHPGANPNDIKFFFEGQDSIVEDTTFGDLTMYFGSGETFHFPQATAYEIDGGGNVVPLTWLPDWNDLGSGYVDLTTFPYNTANTLVIRLGSSGNLTSSCAKNLNWSTYYGGADGQSVADIENRKMSNDFYTLMAVGSNWIAPTAGRRNYSGSSDIFLTNFNSSRNVVWMTYYGSGNHEWPTEMEYYFDSYVNDRIFVLGQFYDLTSSTTKIPFPSPNNGTYKKTSYSNTEEIFIVSFDASGYTDWATYFGGKDQDIPYALEINEAANTLYIAGSTQSSVRKGTCSHPNSSNSYSLDFPVCNANGGSYYQSTFGGGYKDGFLAFFTLDTKALVYSSYFGGDGWDFIQDVKSTGTSSNKLFICGQSATTTIASTISSPTTAVTTGEFPLAKSTGSYLQSATNGHTSGFVSCLDNLSLTWSTFLGGGAQDQLDHVSINSQGDVIVAGNSFSSGATGCSNTSSTHLPICNNNSLSYTENNSTDRDGYIARFNSVFQLEWATFFGKNLAAEEIDDIEHDGNDNLYILGSQWGPYDPISTVTAYNCYDQNTRSGTPLTDPFLVMFNDDNEIVWSTYFGGTEEDGAHALEIKNSKLRFAGSSKSTDYPLCNLTGALNSTLQGGHDAVITEFTLSNGLRTGLGNNKESKKVKLELYPNPTSNILNVSIPKSINIENIQVYNVQGRIVQSFEKIKKSNNSFDLDVSNLSTGIYYIRILDQNNSSLESTFVKVEN